MNPQEALNILDQLTAQINLSRPQHLQVQVAVQTLQAVLDLKAAETKAEETNKPEGEDDGKK